MAVAASGSDRRGLRNVLGIAISAVSLVAFIWWATKQERPEFPTGARELLELAACVAIYALATLLRGWRWHTILRRAHVDHAPADAYALTVVGYMGNNVLPVRSGELLRVLLLGERTTARRRVILGPIIAERFLDLLTIVTLFAALTVGDVGDRPLGLVPLVLVAGVVLAGATVLALLKAVRRRGRLERFAQIVRPFAPRDARSRGLDRCRARRGDRRSLAARSVDLLARGRCTPPRYLPDRGASWPC
jgi:glycosyltransferase 2 family protein